MATRKQKVDSGKTARRVARKVIGTTPSTRVIVPKTERKPKHKKQAEDREREG